MTGSRIDHVTVLAPDLAAGCAWVAAKLGIEMPPGGAHPMMGTHNRLLRLGDGLFFEVIAPDPAVPNPPRPARWFGLADQAALRARGPHLGCWVARCQGIDAVAAAAAISPGIPTTVRRGTLEWRITIPDDGSLPEGGILPALIEWPADRPHPAGGMTDLGVRFAGLTLGHPDPGRIGPALASIGLDPTKSADFRLISADHPSLAAQFHLADGRLVTLSDDTVS